MLNVFVRAYHYGQQGKECLEAYLYYGKTLLEIARMENGVLGHAIKEGKYYEVDAHLNFISVKYSAIRAGFNVMKFFITVLFFCNLSWT